MSFVVDIFLDFTLIKVEPRKIHHMTNNVTGTILCIINIEIFT